eukprot:Awhi_evm1s3094
MESFTVNDVRQLNFFENTVVGQYVKIKNVTYLVKDPKRRRSGTSFCCRSSTGQSVTFTLPAVVIGYLEEDANIFLEFLGEFIREVKKRREAKENTLIDSRRNLHFFLKDHFEKYYNYGYSTLCRFFEQGMPQNKPGRQDAFIDEAKKKLLETVLIMDEFGMTMDPEAIVDLAASMIEDNEIKKRFADG